MWIKIKILYVIRSNGLVKITKNIQEENSFSQNLCKENKFHIITKKTVYIN